MPDEKCSRLSRPSRPGNLVEKRPLGATAQESRRSWCRRIRPSGEATYRRVRADIVYGRLAPGQKLTLERMRDTYGSAVSTLREIFNGLASEGLITAEGARGFEVASISPDNLREVAAMRQLLECDALRSSFEAGDVEWEGRVVAAHHKLATLEKRMAAGDRSEEEVLRRYDWEFHNALISACGSRASSRHARGHLRQVPALPDACVRLSRRASRRGAPQAAGFCAWSAIGARRRR